MSVDVENQRITIVPTQSRPRDHDSGTMLTVRRTISIQAPAVQPSARLPIEFRTLSLHLEHGEKPDNSGKASKGASKGAIKGRPLTRYYLHPPENAHLLRSSC
jgi:hypothetical protein